MAYGFGTGVQAGLGATDYSNYLRGALSGAQMEAQGTAAIGQGIQNALGSIGQGIKKYQENKVLQAEIMGGIEGNINFLSNNKPEKIKDAPLEIQRIFKRLEDGKGVSLKDSAYLKSWSDSATKQVKAAALSNTLTGLGINEADVKSLVESGAGIGEVVNLLGAAANIKKTQTTETINKQSAELFNLLNKNKGDLSGIDFSNYQPQAVSDAIAKFASLQSDIAGTRAKTAQAETTERKLSDADIFNRAVSLNTPAADQENPDAVPTVDIQGVTKTFSELGGQNIGQFSDTLKQLSGPPKPIDIAGTDYVVFNGSVVPKSSVTQSESKELNYKILKARADEALKTPDERFREGVMAIESAIKSGQLQESDKESAMQSLKYRVYGVDKGSGNLMELLGAIAALNSNK